MNSTLLEIVDPKMKEHPEGIGGNVLPTSTARGKDMDRP